MPHVNAMFSSLEQVLTKHTAGTEKQPGVNYYPKNEAKAKTQAFLSGMYKTVPTISLGAECKYWNFGHTALADLKGFLENLSGPA
jgi:hypothetical protein